MRQSRHNFWIDLLTCHTCEKVQKVENDRALVCIYLTTIRCGGTFTQSMAHSFAQLWILCICRITLTGVCTNTIIIMTHTWVTGSIYHSIYVSQTCSIRIYLWNLPTILPGWSRKFHLWNERTVYWPSIDWRQVCGITILANSYLLCSKYWIKFKGMHNTGNTGKWNFTIEKVCWACTRINSSL